VSLFDISKNNCMQKKKSIFEINSDLSIAGKLILPSMSNGFFFVAAVRNKRGIFQFKDGLYPIADNFTLLKVHPDDIDQYCLAAKFDSSKLVLSESDCNLDNATVCRMWKNDVSNCSNSSSFAQMVSY
jgi:hypothetical protein